ncbi:hypothetical protein [Brevibacterium sp.]|uniref:hypothetical protein n=1 Tax=Brevibacterium sp. TaxID=1701 RepID=UPI002810B167|nr:hypothetical protein [Brevibacterium sp.]
MKLFSGLKKLGRADHSPDRQFGTGLWRQHHDRFLRAVDRYYTTAVAISEAEDANAAVTSASTADDATEPPGAPTSELIAAGTHRLNELVPVVDDITRWMHTHCPVAGQVVPAHVRQRVGDAPELMARASAKVAEAVLAASMARTELRAGRPAASSAQACERFIADAAELLARARSSLPAEDVQ